MTITTKTTLNRLRTGVFEIPRRVPYPVEQFEAQLDNAQLADDLGFHSYWAAQAHFSPIGSPSALNVLSAATQRTQRIRLGTAVVTLAFENPLRLAENASVVNALSHNRVELGVGKGNPKGRSSTAYTAFHFDESDRETLFEQQLDSLRRAFHHTEQDAQGITWDFYPAAEGLERRLWQATSTISTAKTAGHAGDGLQLHSGGPEPLGEVQLELINAYQSALPSGVTPRIAVARTVLPIVNNEDEIEQHHLINAAVDTHVLTGSPQEIVDQLLADQTVQAATDLLFRLPLPIESAVYRDSLRILAKDVTPLLTGGLTQTGSAGPSYRLGDVS